MSDSTGSAAVFLWFGVIIATITGWLTHIVHCLSNGEWGFLIAGALFAPVGVIHGWGLWFGWWG